MYFEIQILLLEETIKMILWIQLKAFLKENFKKEPSLPGFIEKKCWKY